MNISELKEVFDRLQRFSKRLDCKRGSGFQWEYCFPDGFTTTYIIKNIKHPSEIEDDIFNLFIWWWNLKDYLKELSVAKGGLRNEIEKIVNSENDLKICADLANKLKHGKLRESRSGIFPSFGELEFSLDSKTISSLTFTDKDVIFDIAQPDNVEVSIPVRDRNGKVITDGLKILNNAIQTFDIYFRKICSMS
jgi:hypothetical protein